MSTFLIGVAVVLGLFIVLLAVPIEISFNVNRIRQTKGQMKIRWLFGLLRFAVNFPGKRKSGKKIAQGIESAINKRSKQTTKKTDSSGFVNLLKNSEFRQRFFKFLKDLLQASHHQDLFLKLRIGLSDPALTGQLWALLGPIAAIAHQVHSATVYIEPEFLDQAFEVQSHGRFRFIPLEFIILILGFLVSPSTVRAWYGSRHAVAA